MKKSAFMAGMLGLASMGWPESEQRRITFYDAFKDKAVKLRKKLAKLQKKSRKINRRA